MKQKRTLVVLLLVIAILCLGIAYAAISNINLQISGTASATANSENFKVYFTGTPETTKSNSSSIVTATAEEGGTQATINCSGLTTKGDNVTATYTIENGSPELTADITAKVSSSNEKFTVTKTIDETTATSVEAKKTTTITVTVTLNETVIDADISEEVIIDLLAVPKQPNA